MSSERDHMGPPLGHPRFGPLYRSQFRMRTKQSRRTRMSWSHRAHLG